MTRNVKTHTRRTASGKTTTVRHHTRRGDSAKGKPARKRGPNPGHAARLGRRGVGHAKRNRKGKAAMFITLAIGEVICWFTLGGLSLILALVAGLLAAISILLVK